MAEHKRNAGESGGVSDSYQATVTTESGIEIVKGPDPDEWAFRDEQAKAEKENQYRNMTTANLKDLAEHRNLDVPSKVNKDQVVKLLLADDSQSPPADGLPNGYAEGNMKGPGPQWARDENGAYANR